VACDSLGCGAFFKRKVAQEARVTARLGGGRVGAAEGDHGG